MVVGATTAPNAYPACFASIIAGASDAGTALQSSSARTGSTAQTASPAGRTSAVNTGGAAQTAQRARRRSYAATASSATGASFAPPASYAATAGGFTYAAIVHLLSSACTANDARNALHASQSSAVSITSYVATAESALPSPSVRTDTPPDTASYATHHFNANTKSCAIIASSARQVVRARTGGIEQPAPSAIQASCASMASVFWGASRVIHRSYAHTA